MKRQRFYLGLNNCNLGSTDSSRNPNSVPFCIAKTRGFYEEKEGGNDMSYKRKKHFSEGVDELSSSGLCIGCRFSFRAHDHGPRAGRPSPAGASNSCLEQFLLRPGLLAQCKQGQVRQFLSSSRSDSFLIWFQLCRFFYVNFLWFYLFSQL